MDDRTLVYFANNEHHIIEAYAESGEGIDRAGGFAVQVCFTLFFTVCVLILDGVQGQGGLLIRKIEGDFNNVVGFPASSFFKFLENLVEEEVDFLSI